ncbi:MAG TPA: hypothetical protein VLZ74_05830 [Methylocella sp.]|nr:hypothetical protein [Methylocella sp.]
MKPGVIGSALFVLGSVALLIFSPLFSPDLALMPPGPVNLPRFTLLYYVPRLVLSGILLAAAVLVIFTEACSKPDKYWAAGMIGAVLISWGAWLRD